MNVGEKIRYLRVKNNMTQRELGDKLGVAHNTVSEYERNVKGVSLPTIERLAKIFNVGTNYFMSDYITTDVSIATYNRMIIEDLLDTLIARGIINDPNNIDKNTIDLLIQAIKKDIEDKLKKQI